MDANANISLLKQVGEPGVGIGGRGANLGALCCPPSPLNQTILHAPGREQNTSNRASNMRANDLSIFINAKHVHVIYFFTFLLGIIILSILDLDLGGRY